jgi:hypothetical protein
MLQPYKDRERRMTDGIHAESRMLGDVKFHSYDRIDVRVGDRWKEEMFELSAKTTWEVAAAFGYERDQRKAAPWNTVEDNAAHPERRTEFPSHSRKSVCGSSTRWNRAIARLTTSDSRAPAWRASRRGFKTESEEILRRHSSLRTSFKMVDGQPVQVIAPPQPFDISNLVDLKTQSPETQREAESLKLATAEAQLPFDLTRGPLLRATLLRLGEVEHISTGHECTTIVSDGCSMGVLVP